MDPSRALSRWPVPAVVGLSLALTAAVWGLDYWTGVEISFSVFYLLPISVAGWFAGGRWALPFCLLAAAAWWLADSLGGRVYSHAAIPYWNAAVRLGFFAIVSWLLVRLRAILDAFGEASRQKSAMMAMVSHEFGNALASLGLASKVLQDSEGGAPPENRKRCYDVLDGLGRHLQAAVANFLNLNRLESGRFRLDPRPTAIRELVKATLRLVEPLVMEKKLEVVLDVPAQVLPVRADPDALALVMSNLVGNAVKYTPAGGRVTVRIIPEGGSRAVISVEDTGIGILLEDQEKILRGQRADDARSFVKGYGIGLTVCRELLESHGARLELESAPGRGSRFFFSLPIWSGGASG